MVVYAELDDFLLAGLRSPTVFLFSLPFFIILIVILGFFVSSFATFAEGRARREMQLSYDIEQSKGVRGAPLTVELEGKLRDFKGSHKKVLRRARRIVLIGTAPIFVMGFIVLFFLVQRDVRGRYDQIVDGHAPRAVVTLRSGETLPSTEHPGPLVFITATEKFLFFRQSDKQHDIRIVVLPIAGVSTVCYLEYDPELDASVDEDTKSQKQKFVGESTTEIEGTDEPTVIDDGTDQPGGGGR